jgi:uncharacterized membrane protein
MTIEEIWSEPSRKKIEDAIASAEKNTSGEIRVHIEERCGGDLFDRAAFVFAELDMHRTKERNGVLIYLAIIDRKVAILGDAGIHQKVPSGFWDDCYSKLKVRFSQGAYTQGVCEIIAEVGDKLSAFFPWQRGDVNELPNTISTQVRRS